MKENNSNGNEEKNDSEVIDFGTGKKTQKNNYKSTETKKKTAPKEEPRAVIDNIPDEVKIDQSSMKNSIPSKENEIKTEFTPIQLHPQKKKKRSWWSSGNKKRLGETKTVVEIKTLGDIPPIVEVRKLIGNGERNEGTVKGFNFAKQDIAKSFGTNQKPGESNRKFLIRILREAGIEIPDEAYVDNTALKNAMKHPFLGGETNKIDALKKLAYFYMDYYEKAKFSNEVYSTGDDIIDKLMDLYNYLDVAKLYYPSYEPVRR
ncbi:MAG: hypothetical protein ACYDAO_04740 [Thermoplasmataceae archaeon]